MCLVSIIMGWFCFGSRAVGRDLTFHFPFSVCSSEPLLYIVLTATNESMFPWHVPAPHSAGRSPDPQWQGLFIEPDLTSASHLHFKPWNHICVLKCFQKFYFSLLEPYYVQFTFMHSTCPNCPNVQSHTSALKAVQTRPLVSMFSLNIVTASANQFCSNGSFELSEVLIVSPWHHDGPYISSQPVQWSCVCIEGERSLMRLLQSHSCFSANFPEDAENNPIWHCERKQTKQDTYCFLI